jgi:hypothetical protein
MHSIHLQRVNSPLNNTGVIEDGNSILEKKQLIRDEHDKIRKHTESTTGCSVLY